MIYHLFSLLLFLCLNSFWFVFLQFFFVKCSNNFFAYRITNNIYPRNSAFIFFNHKNLFRPIWNIVSCKNDFIFWYSRNITNFKFRILIINFFTRVNICACFYMLNFPSLFVYFISMSFFSNNDLLIYYKIYCLYPLLFYLACS